MEGSLELGGYSQNGTARRDAPAVPLSWFASTTSQA